MKTSYDLVSVDNFNSFKLSVCPFVALALCLNYNHLELNAKVLPTVSEWFESNRNDFKRS